MGRPIIPSPIKPIIGFSVEVKFKTPFVLIFTLGAYGNITFKPFSNIYQNAKVVAQAKAIL
jgi:hypothetical protein